MEDLLFSEFWDIAGLGLLFMGLGFVLSIALSIYVVIAYVRDSGQKAETKLGRFLRFETLISDKIIKVVYAILAVCFTVGCVVTPFATAISGGIAGILFLVPALLIAAVVFIVGHVFLRLGYEGVMFIVLITRNTTTIRRSLEGSITSPSPFGGARGTAPIPQAASPSATSAPTAPLAVPGWTCAACGTMNKKGSFCAKCGTPMPRS